MTNSMDGPSATCTWNGYKYKDVLWVKDLLCVHNAATARSN